MRWCQTRPCTLFFFIPRVIFKKYILPIVDLAKKWYLQFFQIYEHSISFMYNKSPKSLCNIKNHIRFRICFSRSLVRVQLQHFSLSSLKAAVFELKHYQTEDLEKQILNLTWYLMFHQDFEDLLYNVCKRLCYT